MLRSDQVAHWVIDLPHDDAVAVQREAPALVTHLRAKVLPDRQKAADREEAANNEALVRDPKARTRRHHQAFLETWWRQAYRREEMLQSFSRLELGRFIALTRVAALDRMSIYVFADVAMRPDDSLATFALDDDYSFGVLSSSLHRAWFIERCSRLKVDPRYTSTTVWDSFPWPPDPGRDVVQQIAQTSKRILDKRQQYVDSGMSLGDMYDALRSAGRSELRDLHRELVPRI